MTIKGSYLFIRPETNREAGLIAGGVGWDLQEQRLVAIGCRNGVVAAALAGMGLAAVSEYELEANADLRIVRCESFRGFGVSHAVCLKSRAQTALLSEMIKCARHGFGA